MNDPKSVENLYVKTDTLQTRIRFHDRYSVNKYGWANWVFDRYSLKEGHRVLEIGCGSGEIWMGRNLPADVAITLTDISGLMLGKARNLLGRSPQFCFEVTDILNMPFPDSTFDTVIANHMLYHAGDLNRALAEVRRVLKPAGTFYATTVGETNLRELNALCAACSAGCNPVSAEGLTFTLENGERTLREQFGGIELTRYADSLEVTDAADLMEYVASCNELGERVFRDIHDRIKSEIDVHGMFRIKKMPACSYVGSNRFLG